MTLPTNLHVCQDEDNFKRLLHDAGSQVVVIHFEAEWAPECKQMNHVFQELAKEYFRAIFIRVEAEVLPDVTRHYEVECVPTFILLKCSRVTDKLEGADAAQLSKIVKHQVTSFVAPVNKPFIQTMNLEERLNKLIRQKDVMIFMKGDPSAPKCGFSRQTIEILQENNVQFGYFDILTDDSVRQGLKKFSDWPTYPQLYGNGELIGGLDIIQELAKNGELVDALTKTGDPNSRLGTLVKKAPLMIFMKGVPENPRCKFSKALMEILKPLNLKFKSFDILEDEEVRQGLKLFSDWPTFPQIYVNGEFIGGLDIIKELHESGELESTLSPALS